MLASYQITDIGLIHVGSITMLLGGTKTRTWQHQAYVFVQNMHFVSCRTSSERIIRLGPWPTWTQRAAVHHIWFTCWLYNTPKIVISSPDNILIRKPWSSVPLSVCLFHPLWLILTLLTLCKNSKSWLCRCEQTFCNSGQLFSFECIAPTFHVSQLLPYFWISWYFLKRCISIMSNKFPYKWETLW
jgi:hypothetical protein